MDLERRRAAAPAIECWKRAGMKVHATRLAQSQNDLWLMFSSFGGYTLELFRDEGRSAYTDEIAKRPGLKETS